MVRALGLIALLAAGPAAAECRQALALGLDVSGSVDAAEYRLQLDGLAAALLDPEVQAALLTTPSAPVSLMVYEWSGPADQHVILDWTAITSAATIDTVALRLHGSDRKAADPSTAIGSALLAGAAALRRVPQCWRHVLDISGDGLSNTGPAPQQIRDSSALQGITVNALAIAPEVPVAGDRRLGEAGALAAYFKAYVIRGPGAFVESADGFDAYQAAMIRKLKRELQGLNLADLHP